MLDALRTKHRDLVIPLVVASGISLGLYLDSDASPGFQLALGMVAWAFLLLLLAAEDTPVRLQVAVAVLFATIGEHFSSPFLGAYIYRFDNVPAYIPPGHGMVYLGALALARSAFMHRFQSGFKYSALLLGGVWSLWGVTLAQRTDSVGALLFCVFAVFVFLGRSPFLYLAAFFLTSYLELVGTWLGTWRWALQEPVFGLSQANPPSGIAAWYCLVDAVALSGGAFLGQALARYGPRGQRLRASIANYGYIKTIRLLGRSKSSESVLILCDHCCPNELKHFG